MRIRTAGLSTEELSRKARNAKEDWLDYHLRKLLGDDLCNRATSEPAIVRTVMKEQGIWLRENGSVMELMTVDKVYSKFILEVRAA